MKEPISCIVLGTVKHSDRHNVTSVYTRERGRIALLTPAGSSKKSRQTSAHLLPLSVVEAQVSISPTRELHIPSAISPIRVWHTIYYNPLKSTVVMFLSEFLNRLLRDAPAEQPLWDFIANSITFFDNADDSGSIANFHISFLIGMTHMMGIHPDLTNYSEGMEFDMKAGKTVLPFAMQSNRGIRIDAHKTAFLPKLSRINYANARLFRFNGHERSEVLDDILKYFGCHFPGSDNLKSLSIIKEIFQ